MLEKKVTQNLDFGENNDFNAGSTEAGFRVCSTVNSEQKPVAESYISKVIGR